MGIEPYYIVLVIFWLLILLFIRKEILLANKLSSSDKNYIYWTQVVLFIGILIRSVELAIPAGINVDEAMCGYNSWCLAHYGVDQHLASYPVYLKAWGSGMNALYAYLAIPFIKIFGLSIGIFRLPMVLISCCSLIVFYKAIQSCNKDYYFIFIVIFILAISPWHIMKSRWALESNLAPDLILIGTCFLIMGFNALTSLKRNIYYMAGFAVVGLAAYSYAVVWVMLPVYFILLLVYFYKKGKINNRQILLFLTGIFILVFPLILFSIQLITKGEQYELGPITITAMKESRLDNISTTFLNSMKFGVRMILFGSDNLPWNSFSFFGQFYNILGIPFILLALAYLGKYRKLDIMDVVFIFIFIASITVVIIVPPNVNRWNTLWFPFIYFMARGLYICTKTIKWRQYIAISVFTVLFLSFGYKYITSFNKPGSEFWQTGFAGGYEKKLEFTKSRKFNKIFFEGVYIYTLFYQPINPYEYDASHYLAEENKEEAIEYMAGYGNFNFRIPQQILPTPNTAYILQNRNIDSKIIEYDKFHIERGDLFTLLWTD